MKQKILYGLLALAVSFGLWLYVITVENPASEITFYNIPVVLDNESVLTDRGLMVLNSKNPTVTLKLSGNRSHLSKLNSSNITLVSDLSRIYDSGEQTISYTISFPGDIPQNSIEILSQLPAQINLTVVERGSKEIPVNVTYNGKVPDGFMTDKENLVLNHKTIHVTGAATMVNEIAEARIVVDLEGKKEPIVQSYRYSFYDKNGNLVDDDTLLTNVSEVSLSLNIQRYKEIPIVIGNVISGGGATAENTIIKLDVATIGVAGSEQLLNGLEYVQLGDIDLGLIEADTVLSFNLNDKLPEGITNISGVEQVNVTITLPELETRTLPVSQFVPKNLPAGMEAKILNKQLSVKIRGNASEIGALTAEQIVVIVDFANAELGRDSYPVSIQIIGYSNVGPMGSYTVNAELTNTPSITAD